MHEGLWEVKGSMFGEVGVGLMSLGAVLRPVPNNVLNVMVGVSAVWAFLGLHVPCFVERGPGPACSTLDLAEEVGVVVGDGVCGHGSWFGGIVVCAWSGIAGLGVGSAVGGVFPGRALLLCRISRAFVLVPRFAGGCCRESGLEL